MVDHGPGATGTFPLIAGTPLAGDPGALVGTFDLLVVGGGIYGAWTALEGALRGLRVALVERGDWASGTSRTSSKLIHGGLRYLEHGDVGLVRKALRERTRLLRLAPHRVRPLRFVVPVTQHGRLSRPMLHAGLFLYDLLAGGDLAGVERHAAWRRNEVLHAAPFLTPDVVGGFTYGDAGTDDAALVRDIVAAAQRSGAVCCAHTPVTALSRTNGSAPSGQVTGAFLMGGESIRARHTVLAAGPWACALAGLDARQVARFTKGVHVVLPPLPLRGPFTVPDTAFLLTAPQDGRVFFLIPWHGGTMVGTTDTDWLGDPDDIRVERADVDYLLAAVTATCPGLGWTVADVRDAWVGLRTMRRATGGASALSREWELLRPAAGLLLPLGGKLTSARVEAVHIIDAVHTTDDSGNSTMG